MRIIILAKFVQQITKIHQMSIKNSSKFMYLILEVLVHHIFMKLLENFLWLAIYFLVSLYREAQSLT